MVALKDDVLTTNDIWELVKAAGPAKKKNWATA